MYSLKNSFWPSIQTVLGLFDQLLQISSKSFSMPFAVFWCGLTHGHFKWIMWPTLKKTNATKKCNEIAILNIVLEFTHITMDMTSLCWLQVFCFSILCESFAPEEVETQISKDWFVTEAVIYSLLAAGLKVEEKQNLRCDWTAGARHEAEKSSTSYKHQW